MTEEMFDKFEGWINEGMDIYMESLAESDDPMVAATRVYLKSLLDSVDDVNRFKLSCKVLGDTLIGASE